MQTLKGRLLDLVRKLDDMGPEPSLATLARAMEATRLAPDDVAAFVEANPRSYHRASVALREQYELLVMTWLPGQSSVPHDHTGSICVMQVVEGDAVEGCYRTAADGYVDLEYETTVRAGEVTSGQDAGVHTVRNASTGQVLVTVHIYAPPLRDFRKFVPRPVTPDDVRPTPRDRTPTVVIVGGGFSGATTAAQVLRRAEGAGTTVRVVLVERQGTIGEGLAYSTRDASHLLNVPAGRMSAWPDRPNDFVDWASRRRGQVLAGDFVPRRWYGEYIRETLLTAAHGASAWATFSVVFDEIRRIGRHPAGGWMVHLARGDSFRADAVVLAIGHRPPSDPIGAKWSGPRTRFIADPWRPFGMNVVRPDEPVAILGSGLTAIDAVLSLAQEPRRAPITMISRNGLLPKAHAAAPVAPANLQPLVEELFRREGGVRALDLSRKLRRKADELAASGADWRSIVDGLRPHTATLWRAMSSDERRRFLTRLRPFWEVHRHRMAVAVAERFKAMLDRGEVRVVAGRVESVQAGDESVRLLLRERKTDRMIESRCAWVINCTGPVPSNSAESNPAIGSLLVHGWLRPDELALGIETTADGNAVDTGGQEVPDLFVVGTLCKPAFWESTAVPELRNQAATVAGRVLALVKT